MASDRTKARIVLLSIKKPPYFLLDGIVTAGMQRMAEQNPFYAHE
jgi:hypothetical protein